MTKREAAEINIKQDGWGILCAGNTFGDCPFHNICNSTKTEAECVDFCTQWLKDNPEEKSGDVVTKNGFLTLEEIFSDPKIEENMEKDIDRIRRGETIIGSEKIKLSADEGAVYIKGENMIEKLNSLISSSGYKTTSFMYHITDGSIDIKIIGEKK